MKRTCTAIVAAALVALALASPASAAFGLKDVEVEFLNEDGSPAVQAGSHPFAMRTTVDFNITEAKLADGEIKDLVADLPPGLIGDPTAVPRCSNADFLVFTPEEGSACSDASAVGVVGIRKGGEASSGDPGAVYNLTPPPGVTAKIGFHVLVGVAVTLEVGINPDAPNNLRASLSNIPQAEPNTGAVLTIWGNPANPVHDAKRGNCVWFGKGICTTNLSEKPFLTLPTSCTGPLESGFKADSWQAPGVFDQKTATTEFGMSGCDKLRFTPTITAKPTTLAARSPSGLDFSLDVKDEGLANPTGLARSQIKKAVVTLPEGFTTNPSIAEGLNVCSEADLARESAFSAPGAGCPNASKIGTVEVETPLLDENVNGSLYIAKPYENPFGSLLALYIVIKNPTLGIVVRQPLEVRPDPVTGRLTTIAEDLPQLPFSHFRLHFREGARSPLASPPSCGTYDASAELTPWSGGVPLTTTSAFEIITGPGGGPCPTGGLPPFKPGLVAGTLNNAAGRFSPFNLRLSRTDSEQEFTRFSIKLPPGIAAILAGVPYCPDAAIEAAKQRSGAEEIASPSCPAASEIGHTLAGAGVGPSLAYAPGKIYLAGPYKGTVFSLAAITAAKVGPFDLGTVVVRQGFKVDRETAEVFIDATESDPIPHIIDGIPVHLRDIRAYVDRSKFVFNPTSCERTSTASTLLGSGLDFGSAVDDRPVTVSTPFQAADCAALEFKPKLKLALRGATKRGGHPALRAELRMNGGPEKGEANIARAQVTLPHSAFLENAHIKTICTRVQFRADQCPPGSVYGYARAYTPVLAEPVQGPVYLRSSEHQLPDLVASLHSEKITVDLVGRIDSLRGRIRNTFEAVPDAPVTKFVLTMQGAKKGLIVNSTDLCKGTHRAIADFSAQNGKVSNTRPALKVKCGGKGKGKRRAG